MLDNNINKPPATTPVLAQRPNSSFGPQFSLLVTVVLFLIVVFVLGFFEETKKSPIQAEVSVLSGELAKSGEDQLFVQIAQRVLSDVAKEGDGKTQYKAVFDLAQGVSARYSDSHNPKLRGFMESLGVFARKSYPSYYQESDFFVLCADEECAKLVYKPEILEIKNEAEKIDLGLNKEGVLNALYNASLVSGGTTLAESDREVDNLGFALSILHTEAENGNASARNLETKLFSYLKRTYPDYVVPWESARGRR